MAVVKKTTTTTQKVKKAEKKVEVKVSKAIKTPKTTKMESALTVVVYDIKGKEVGTIELPKEVFGAKINPVLMAQAVRVYLANQRQGDANTKTRGQVDGSTRKIYRQKGTGRARHGGVRAPIFVGGGIAHGPKIKEYALSLSKKMKKAAVISALSQMVKDGKIKVISGFDKIEPKTKIAAQALSTMNVKKALLVMPKHSDNVLRAARNIEKVKVVSAALLTTYDILNAGTLVLMKEAIEVIGSTEAKEGGKA